MSEAAPAGFPLPRILRIRMGLLAAGATALVAAIVILLGLMPMAKRIAEQRRDGMLILRG